MKKLFIISQLILVSFLLLICGCSGCNKSNTPASYTITFIIDGEPYLTDSVVFGKTVNKPVIENKDGYIFKCWYTSDDYIDEWDFEEPVYKSFTLYGYWVESEHETFNVSYFDGDELIRNDKIVKGNNAEKFTPDKAGYIFVKWVYGDETFDYSNTVDCDIRLQAVWDAVNYKIKFTADNEIVAEESYTADNRIVNIPEIPEKEHYSAKWTTFEYNLEDIEVPAIYTPINYSATFYVDDEIFLELNYSVEDEIEIPEVPSKYGYTGCWSGLPIEGGDVTITAQYTPIDYLITYVVNDTVIETMSYNIENKDITPPAIPELRGYEGVWEYKELDTGDVIVNAVYSIKVFKAYFSVENNVIKICEFTIETENIDEPEIPYKEGYTGTWKQYILGSEDITIEAEYNPIKYTAYFIIEDTVVAEVEFTVNDKTISEPQIPAKTGYEARWEPYYITSSDIRIKAVYTIVTYFASFVYQDSSIVKVPYTIKDTTINEPPLPIDENYATKWEAYNLPYTDFEINIKYIERIPSVTLGNLKFTLLDNDTYCLSEYLVNDNLPLGNPESEIYVPEEVNYLPVTAIGSAAFGYKTNFNKITIPESVIEIGEYAFTYTSLTSIILPSNLKEIKNIFVGCNLLESVTIGTNTQKICENAFVRCIALKSIIIPKSIKCIERNAFYECTSLENVVFEDCDNWSIYNAENNSFITEINSATLSDSVVAAQYLTSDKFYLTRTWIHE